MPYPHKVPHEQNLHKYACIVRCLIERRRRAPNASRKPFIYLGALLMLILCSSKHRRSCIQFTDSFPSIDSIFKLVSECLWYALSRDSDRGHALMGIRSRCVEINGLLSGDCAHEGRLFGHFWIAVNFGGWMLILTDIIGRLVVDILEFVFLVTLMRDGVNFLETWSWGICSFAAQPCDLLCARVAMVWLHLVKGSPPCWNSGGLKLHKKEGMHCGFPYPQ